VAHIGQELRFVLRGECKLRCLFFQRAAGLLDLLVFGLDFDVAFSELLRLLFELLVCLLQFALLGLQFTGELLGLLEQSLGLHGRLNGVEHDAD